MPMSLQQAVCRAVEHPDKRAEDKVKRPQRQGHEHGRALGILHGKGFGRKLAKHDMQGGNRERTPWAARVYVSFRATGKYAAG